MPSPTRDRNRCAGSRRFRLSRRRRTSSGSWPNGSNARETWRVFHHAPHHDRTSHAPVHRRGIPREHSRRTGNLDLRRAGEGRHGTSRVPEHGAHDRTAVRRAARSGQEGDADRSDRHRKRRVYPPVLPRHAHCRRTGRRARCDRGMGPHQLRMDRAKPGLQSRVSGDAWRQRRLLRAVRRQREALVQEGSGRSVVRQPCDRESARSIATGLSTKSRTCTCTSRRRQTAA